MPRPVPTCPLLLYATLAVLAAFVCATSTGCAMSETATRPRDLSLQLQVAAPARYELAVHRGAGDWGFPLTHM